MCEESIQDDGYFRQWSITNIWMNIKYLLHKLRVALETRQLRNFFIDQNNMIDHLEREQVEPILSYVNQLLADPLQCLLRTYSLECCSEDTTIMILDRSRVVVSWPGWIHILTIALYPVFEMKHLLYRRPRDGTKNSHYNDQVETIRCIKCSLKYFNGTTTIISHALV